MSEGLLLMAEQHHHAAIVSLHEAIEDWRPRRLLRPIVGTLLVTLAQAQQATGDRAGAQASIERSLEALAHWPGWRRDRAEALAVRLAGHDGPSGRAN